MREEKGGELGGDFLEGGGEMGERIRNFDWSSTPLGAIADWPQSMRLTVSLCVKSSFPIIIHWGWPTLTVLYNDAFLPFAGEKHPKLLGRPLFESWPELQPTLGPMLESVLTTGKAALSDDLLLVYNRSGYLEETYYTLSFNPIVLESGRVGGSFSLIDYTTDRVIGERRLRTLRDLAARTGEAKRLDESYRLAAEVLASNPHDIPFALLYMLEGNRKQARLVSAVGVEQGGVASPTIVDLTAQEKSAPGWPLTRAASSARAERVDSLEAIFGPLPGGAWHVSPRTAVVLPVTLPGHELPSGILVAAVNPRKVLDDAYQSFFNSVATQIAASLVGVMAYESLVELDRAKTAFFSNVSHEFRTPLSLILGPLEDILVLHPTPSTIIFERRDLELMHRNGLRLLRLVNTLLDFSRIEAGRIQAVYEPVDLAAYTTELASTFRSAMSRAGLRFVIDCPPLDIPVYVDRDMWEKIVLNLVSNAFKYTLDGEVVITIRVADDSVELAIRDTGVGIPDVELPRLFERFHRVEGQRGRTTEGTGIGLALVQELVKLHGGMVRVQSVLGSGTTFTVTIPFGTDHLPNKQIGRERTLTETVVRPEAFVEEALRWLPGEAVPAEAAIEKELIGPRSPGPTVERAVVLVADDNADMLEYVRRLLATRYEVEAVPDGQAAFDAARARRPDLILTDVMMPRLDGFSLLKAVRADNALRDVPVVLLSARAGEEAKVEGLEAGADDYLLKPFSARELIARVDANLRMARLRHTVVEERKKEEFARRYGEERHRIVVETANDAVVIMDESGAIQFANAATMRVFGYDPTELIGKPLTILMPEPMRKLHEMGVRRYLATGQRHMNWRGTELTGLRKDGKEFPVEVSFGELTNNGRRVFTGFIRDISERKRAEETLRRSEAYLAEGQRLSHTGSWHWNVGTGRVEASKECRSIFGVDLEKNECSYSLFVERVHPEDRSNIEAIVWAAVKEKVDWELECRVFAAEGAIKSVYSVGHCKVNRFGEIEYIGISMDITERKHAEEERERLRQAQAELAHINRVSTMGELTASLAHEIKQPITAAVTDAQACLRWLDRDQPAVLKAREAASRLIGDAKRASDIISRIGSLFKKDIVHRELVDLNDVIQEMIILLRSEAARYSITIDSQLSDGLPKITADRIQLQQVLMNLMINGIEAMKDLGSSGALNIRSQENENRHVMVSVHDNGTGLTPERVDEIFNAFFTTKPKGTGLGLAISRSIVESHGGRLWATCDDRPGATFHFTLPIEANAHQAA